MRISLALAVPALVWGCTDSNTGRMKPIAVPELTKPAATAPRGRTEIRKPTPAAAAKFAEVPTERVTSAAVTTYLIELRRQQGDAALRALRPGKTLVERLRYCSSRIVLEEHDQVLDELTRLARRHPTTAMVWRQLGLAQYFCGQRQAAVQSVRRAYEEAAKSHFAEVPDLPSFLGTILLEQSATRAEGEQLLRQELADGADFKNAALVLEAHFRQREQHIEGLGVLTAALERDKKDLDLLIAKAKLLIDLHQPERALAITKPLVAAADAAPQVLETTYRAHVLRRDYEAAIAMIDRLLKDARIRGRDRTTLVEDRKAFVAAQRSGKLDRWSVWMIAAVLRGHPSLEARVEVLRSAIKTGNKRLIGEALRVCFNSTQELLRAAALREIVPISAEPLVNLRVGLADASSKVRALAATLAGRQTEDRSAVQDLVLEYMANESDTYTFRQMHGAMVKLTGTDIELPFGAAGDPEQRKEIVARWRQVK